MFIRKYLKTRLNPEYLTISLITLVVVLALWQWKVLARHELFITKISFWFWVYKDKSINSIPALLTLIVLLVTLLIVLYKRHWNGWWRLACICFTAILMHFSFAYLTSNEFAGFGHSGHQGFFKAAVANPNIFDTLHNYEILMDSGNITYYAKSKPPGQLLFFSVTANLSDLIWPTKDPALKLENAGNLARFSWPLLAFILLIPFYSLTRLLADENVALLACALIILFPAMQLITLYTDQCLFPLLGVSMAWATAFSYKSRIYYAAAILTGIGIYLALYFTFALLALAPICLAVLWIVHTKYEFKIKRLITFGLLMLMGIGVAALTFYIWLNYDPFIRYEKAILNHIYQKGFVAGLCTQSIYGKLNLVEFTFWSGAAVTVVFLYSLVIDQSYRIARLEPIGFFTLSIVIVIITLAYFGKTLGEVARLWIFILPFIAISISYFIENRVWRKQIFLMILIPIQFFTILFFKLYMDFV